jgi:hypothetical protein
MKAVALESTLMVDSFREKKGKFVKVDLVAAETFVCFEMLCFVLPLLVLM